jgi:hypothetical protein
MRTKGLVFFIFGLKVAEVGPGPFLGSFSSPEKK